MGSVQAGSWLTRGSWLVWKKEKRELKINELRKMNKHFPIRA